MISSSVMFISFTLLNRMFPDPCVTMCSIVSWRTKLDNFPKRFAPRRHCTRTALHSELTYVAHAHMCTYIDRGAGSPAFERSHEGGVRQMGGRKHTIHVLCLFSFGPPIGAGLLIAKHDLVELAGSSGATVSFRILRKRDRMTRCQCLPEHSST